MMTVLDHRDREAQAADIGADGQPGDDVNGADDRLTLGWRIVAAIRSFALTVGAILGIFCIAMTGYAMVTQTQPAIVISGSMEPTIPVGAITFAQNRAAAELSVGDVVTVQRQNADGLVTHRIVSAEPTESGSVSLVLRGDANQVDDPEPYVLDQARVVVFSVPYLGYVADAFRGPMGIVAIVIVLCSVVAGFVIDPARIGKRMNEDDDDTLAAGEQTGPVDAS